MMSLVRKCLWGRKKENNTMFTKIILALCLFFVRLFSAVKYVLCFYFEEGEKFSDCLIKRKKNVFINN